MLHALAILGFGWMIYELCSWIRRGFRPKIDKSTTFQDFGDNIMIAGVPFTKYCNNGYTDPTESYIYARNLNNQDYFWTGPGISITRHQFFEDIQNLKSTLGSNNRTVSKKRA